MNFEIKSNLFKFKNLFKIFLPIGIFSENFFIRLFSYKLFQNLNKKINKKGGF